MPIYEYQCQKCHHHLEALQKFSDKPLRECPECGKHSLKRLISAPMFRLAGSGWYETDFKSDKESKRNLAGKDHGPPAEIASADKPAKTDASAEKKPEPKPESKPEPRREPRRESVSTRKNVAATRSDAKPVARPKPAAKKAAPKKTVRKR
jgi:putative FmdB family regulatory protein